MTLSTANVNVGVLGHVDSGKTSLSKALSRVGSTAAFDKNPQSQARGITLDLGFSAFDVDVAEDEAFAKAKVGRLQFTLVDCPGHASLIRTVLGGAQIIDLMILVIDVTKGIQTQTAECIVVGEILSRRLVVVLNKVDAVQGNTDADKQAALQKMVKKLRATFSQTRWPNVPFIQVAANPGAGEGADAQPPIGVDKLTDHLTALVKRDLVSGRNRFIAAPLSDKSAANNASPAQQAKELLMLVDHCFPIKGQGTVMTGTVLQGIVRVGDEVFLPDHQLTKKVKGIQMFKKPVQEARKGDRIGLCVTQFSAEQMERGIVCGVGGKAVTTIRTCVARVHKVRFHKLDVEQSLKYHLTVGHTTVMGTMRLFSRKAPADTAPSTNTATFDFGASYDNVDDLPDSSRWNYLPPDPSAEPEDHMSVKAPDVEYYAVLQLEHPVTTYVGATIIVSRLDTDVHAHVCRIAAHGEILTREVKAEMFPSSFPVETEPWRMINVIKPKRKLIAIDRVLDDRSCISKSITVGSQNQDPARFVGAKITLRRVKPPSAGSEAGVIVGEPVPGIIEAPFGNNGKVKLRFSADVFEKPAPRTRRRGGRRGGARGGKKGEEAAGADDGGDDDEEEDADDAAADGKPDAGADAAGSAGGGPGKTRIEIDLSYKKRPFATRHRFA